MCGYSHTGGLGGTTLTSSASDDKGFRPGFEYTLSFTGEMIRYHDDEGKLDMKKEGLKDEYYLFVVLYHNEASCLLELLWIIKYSIVNYYI